MQTDLEIQQSDRNGYAFSFALPLALLQRDTDSPLSGRSGSSDSRPICLRLGRRHQLGNGDLTAHRQVSSLGQLLLEWLHQRLERADLGRPRGFYLASHQI